MIRKLVLFLAALSVVATSEAPAAVARAAHHTRHAPAKPAHGDAARANEDCAPSAAKPKSGAKSKAHTSRGARGKADRREGGEACKAGLRGAKGARSRASDDAQAADAGDEADAACAPAARGRHGRSQHGKQKAHAKPQACKSALRATPISAQSEEKSASADCEPVKLQKAKRGRKPRALSGRALSGRAHDARCATARGERTDAALRGEITTINDEDCAPAAETRGRGKHVRKSPRDKAPGKGGGKGHDRRTHGRAKAHACATHNDRESAGGIDARSEACTDTSAAANDSRPERGARKAKDRGHGRSGAGRGHATRAKASGGRRASGRGRRTRSSERASASARRHCIRSTYAESRRPLQRAESPALPMTPRYLPPPIPRDAFAELGSAGGTANTGARSASPMTAPTTGATGNPSTTSGSVATYGAPYGAAAALGSAQAGAAQPVAHRPNLFELWTRHRAEERKTRPAAARMTLAGMVGRSDSDLKSSLGEPDVRRTEGDGALWTYRMPTCSLLVFLRRPAAGEAFKVTGAQAGPLGRGEALPDVDACLKSGANR